MIIFFFNHPPKFLEWDYLKINAGAYKHRQELQWVMRCLIKREWRKLYTIKLFVLIIKAFLPVSLLNVFRLIALFKENLVAYCQWKTIIIQFCLHLTRFSDMLWENTVASPVWEGNKVIRSKPFNLRGADFFLNMELSLRCLFITDGRFFLANFLAFFPNFFAIFCQEKRFCSRKPEDRVD